MESSILFSLDLDVSLTFSGKVQADLVWAHAPKNSVLSYSLENVPCENHVHAD